MKKFLCSTSMLTTLAGFACGGETTATSYLVCVSNERAGTITIIDGSRVTTSGTAAVVATVPVGKRPRGIEGTSDGKLVYVALSGSPIQGPPKLDSEGNPIEEEPDKAEVDHSHDGIGVVDMTEKKFLRKLPAGSDPEEFDISKDNSTLYVANEDVATMSVVSAETGEVETIVPVHEEPEGVNLSPDGRHVYVTCETKGEVVVVDTAINKELATFTVGGRPRSTAFLPDGSKAFVPSESSGKIHVIDTTSFKTDKIITLPAGSRPMGLVISPDGSRLYASTGRGGKVAVVDVKTLEVTGAISVGTRPWGIAVSPDGKYLFTANGPSNDVSVIDVAENAEVSKIPAGEGPWGLTVVPAR